jgi:hypothetical protein
VKVISGIMSRQMAFIVEKKWLIPVATTDLTAVLPALFHTSGALKAARRFSLRVCATTFIKGVPVPDLHLFQIVFAPDSNAIAAPTFTGCRLRVAKFYRLATCANLTIH